MGAYSVPEEIRAYKPVGTCVKNIKNHFYVYEQNNLKGEDGKWHRKSGRCIGKIEYGIGFVPNETLTYEEKITTLEYGQYAVALSNSRCVLERLLLYFSKKDAYRIYLVSVIHAVNSFRHRKAIGSYFEQSCLSIMYPSLSFSEKTLAALMDSLGRRQLPVQAFQQSLIDSSSGEIAIDGHVVRNCSHNNDIAAFGNKYQVMKDTQLNLLMAYDINQGDPIFSKIYEGGCVDKISVEDAFRTYGFRDTLFVVDRGFYSEKNITMFSENGNKYIIPLSENLSAYKAATREMVFDDTFVYEKNKKRSAISYKETTIDGNRVIVYRDSVLNAVDADSYRKNIGIKSSCTMEKYNELKDFFGTIVLQTNTQSTPAWVYEKYKNRWNIETFYNHFKNDLDFNALYEQDYYKLEGMSFIMLTTSLVYECMRKAASTVEGLTLDDCLLTARFIKIHYEKGKWVRTNMRKNIQEMMTALNVDFKADIP